MEGRLSLLVLLHEHLLLPESLPLGEGQQLDQVQAAQHAGQVQRAVALHIPPQQQVLQQRFTRPQMFHQVLATFIIHLF